MKYYKFELSPFGILCAVLFFVFSIWWVIIAIFLKNGSQHANLLWASSYQLMAIFGIIIGLIISKSWGGFKSLTGRIVIFFCIGLILQVFGQTVFSFYNLILKVELPYPSLADIGFFGSIPFYIYGTYLISSVCTVNNTFKSYKHKIIIFIIPVLFLAISYFLALKNYQYGSSNLLETFLDFGYPMGQAFYVSLALFTFIFSRKFLGGIMKQAVFLTLGALFIQYIADFNFLFQLSNWSWVNGGYGDFLYLLSYTVMVLALISLDTAFKKIRSENFTISSIRPVLNTPNKKLYNQIIVEIIKRQIRMSGQLAWNQVRQVKGIVINDESIVDISMTDQPKAVIDQLVSNYRDLFGDVAVEVSKNAVRYLVAELPNEEVPNILK